MMHHNDPEHLPEHYNLLFTTTETNLTRRSDGTVIPIELSDGNYILEYVYIDAFNQSLTRVDMDCRSHEITLDQAKALIDGCGPLTFEERHVTRPSFFRIPAWVPQTIRVLSQLDPNAVESILGQIMWDDLSACSCRKDVVLARKTNNLRLRRTRLVWLLNRPCRRLSRRGNRSGSPSNGK